MERRRRRSALSLCSAAALVTAVPLLSACGQDTHPGAAAVVDGSRISESQLQSQVGEVRKAQRAAPQGEQMIKQTGRLTKATLDGMIRERIVAHAAEEAGIHVTRRQLQQERRDFERQAGGAKRLEQALLQQQAIAPGEIDSQLRMQLRIDRIAQREGIDPRTPQGNAALTRKLQGVSKAMSIDVNPRYGEWDQRKTALGEARSPWLRDLSGREADREQQRPM
ncbi:SurA N-terminal domain-containing protein [Streptomyces sulphureus]|uniref:SurA N-terminal domain-containing protein n=1 Tax=Streptomyces sulphureus TaxID=47758 RepID=UPI0003689208|nr:SurA N-terminal domain-containing protein [Streptomyces sulphureus]